MADVIRAIDGPDDSVTACSTEEGQCEQYAKCNVRDPLYRVREKILAALGECTIAELAADPLTPPPPHADASGGASFAFMTLGGCFGARLKPRAMEQVST